MGRQVAVKVQQRFGRSLLELGGNNALIGTYCYYKIILFLDCILRFRLFSANSCTRCRFGDGSESGCLLMRWDSWTKMYYNQEIDIAPEDKAGIFR